MASNITSTLQGDDKMAGHPHQELNKNLPRRSTRHMKTPQIPNPASLSSGTVAPRVQEDKVIKTEDNGIKSEDKDQVMLDLQVQQNSNGAKRKLGATNSDDASGDAKRDSTQPNLGGGDRIKAEEMTKESESEPPRKRVANGKKPTGYMKYHRPMQEGKPEPFGEPPVWADKRQNLCEALPYYRAYMSGAYMHDRLVRAFLVDKEVGPRDKFNEEIIITRVGGGRRLDVQSGNMVHAKDQNTSAVGVGLQNAKDTKTPVAMIAGQGNTVCPSKLPHQYNVLDWFHVTDVWCEKLTGLKCWMVRFEKINLSDKSWWAPINSPLPDHGRDINAIKTASMCCGLCHNNSKQIFKQGWTCLATMCGEYFKFASDTQEKTLEYAEEFIEERTRFSGKERPPLVPPLPNTRDAESQGTFGYELCYKRGIVCPVCKGCARRIEWRQWTCETPGCSFSHKAPQSEISVRDAAMDSNFAKTKELCNEGFGIRRTHNTLGHYAIDTFVIPGSSKNEVVGIIKHFKSHNFINAQRNGPDDLFDEMQRDDFGLKRHPARQNGSSTEVLTSHWAANWGAPYKYGVSVLTEGFDKAPSAIIKALKRLTWAGEQIPADDPEQFSPFNELLSIGYFENTSIGYHDDGEKELGPTVATLSLGASAIMSLRPKAKSGLGPESKNAKGTKGDVLRFKVCHGDMVIMHGSGIQKLYEHAVTPHGKLRFALTCRYVRPELLANDHERELAEVKSRLPDGHERYNYDGNAAIPDLEIYNSRLPSLFPHLLATSLKSKCQ